MELAELQAMAGAQSPMGGALTPIIRGRTLYLDGDGLAYYCAGGEDCSLERARSFVFDKVRQMKSASQSERVVILLTASGSHKGHRYAIARAKPYQVGRLNSRRPTNWQGLRDMLEAGVFGTTIRYADREADDGFGQYGHADPLNTVTGSDDKDMRMVPGYHIGWRDNSMCYLAPNQWSMVYKDKQYGLKWFWLQMLHGDLVDGIPGVPLAWGKKCGEKTAAKYIAMWEKAATEDGTLREINSTVCAGVFQAYQSCYGDGAATAMLEQAALLWMRRGPDADWKDVLQAGGPLQPMRPLLHDAIKEITERVNKANELNAASTD